MQTSFICTMYKDQCDKSCWVFRIVINQSVDSKEKLFIFDSQAKVVCHQLGYNAVSESTLESTYGLVPNKFSFGSVKCKGNESNLNECNFTSGDNSNCQVYSSAGVNCYNGSMNCEYFLPVVVFIKGTF